LLATRAGLPNANFFPYDTLEAQVAKPERWTPTPNTPGDGDDDEAAAGISGRMAAAKVSDVKAATHVTVPHASNEANPMKKIDLTSALQYGTAEGYPPLRSFIRQFTREHLHPNVPYLGGPEVILTVGSTDGFAKTLELLTNPWSPDIHEAKDRQGLLCEVFVYSNALGQALPRGMQAVAVEIDGEGMMASGPGGLEDVLSNWDERNGKRPHLMYTVT
jgi:DNA-binding transcriptional MocR family regulator